MFECLALFGAFPFAVALTKPHGWIYSLLWIMAALSWRIIGRHGHTFKDEWNFPALNRTVIAPILLRFIPFALLLLAFTWFMIPEHFFSLPRQRPQVWVMVMIFYPLLSVVPQEIVFRSYFIKRFSIFLSPRAVQICSAIAFGWAHIVLQNWVAVVFSAIGGYLFAGTYIKTKSLACAFFEHSLYGCYIFTIGLGYYFYHDQAVH